MQMNKLVATAYALMLGLILFALPVYAETLKGEVKEISSQANYIKLHWTDPKSGKTEEIKVTVAPSTQFNGAKSLGEFRVGDEVIVEADHDVFTRQWKAKMIAAPTAGSMPGI
jgi:hypothetical protein